MKTLFGFVLFFVSVSALANPKSGSCEASVSDLRKIDQAEVKIDGPFQVLDGYQFEVATMVDQKTHQKFMKVWITDHNGEFAKDVSQVLVSLPQAGELMSTKADLENGGFVLLRCVK